MSNVAYVICIIWDDPKLVPCVKRQCAICGGDVALDAKNQALAAKCKCVCVSCWEEHRSEESECIGAFIQGKHYKTLSEAALAVGAVKDRN